MFNNYFLKVLKRIYSRSISIYSILLVIAILYTLQYTPCFAQSFNFKTFSVEDGLSQSQVSCIYQDSKGYLWFGTQSGGVCKFDGRTFITYTKYNGLSNNQVYTVLEDRKGNIWFGTQSGVSIFDGKKFISLPEPLKEITSAIVRAIYQESDATLLFGTNRGVYQWDGEKLSKYDQLDHKIVSHIYQDSRENTWFATLGSGVIRLKDGVSFNYTTEDGLADNSVWSIIEDHTGTLWLGTGNGISKFMPGKDDGSRENFIPFIAGDGLNNQVIRSLIEDNDNNIWISTLRNGVCKFDGINATFFTTKQGLSNDGIQAMLEDREGNIWLGTDGGGIIKCNSSAFSSITERDGLMSNLVLSVLEDSKGNLWFGTYKGVSVFDGHNFFHYNENNGIPSEKVWSIIEDRNGQIWISTYGSGVFKYDPSAPLGAPSTMLRAGAQGEPLRTGGKIFVNYNEENGLSNNNVRTIFEDSKGNIWIGTVEGLNKFNGKGFKIYTLEDGLVSDRILAIMEDSKGNLWFATSGGGLSKLIYDDNQKESSEGKKFVNYTDKEGLSNNTVLSIAEDREGYIWCANFSGVSRIDPDSVGENHISNITRSQGLSSNSVYIIVIDDQGDLLIGSNNGIDKLDLDKFNNGARVILNHYGRDEGFSGIECNTNAYYKDKDGNIWFGTIKGAIKYTPKQDQVNAIEPLTHINNIRLFFEEFDWALYSDNINSRSGLPTQLTLPHNQNHLTFDFIGISMLIPEKVLYRFKLNGFDKGWVPVTKETSATYSNLSPGEYTFEVVSENSDGVWNKKAATFAFVITPPYWHTWWFYFLCAIVGGGALWGAYVMRLRSLERIKKRLKQQVKLRTAEMVRQKKEIEVQRDKYHLLFEQIADTIFIFDRKTHLFLDCNETATRIYGYTKDEIKKMKPFDLHPPEDIPTVKENINIKSPEMAHIYTHITKYGERMFVEIRSEEIEYNGRQAWISIIRDTTERKKTEEKIEEQNFKLEKQRHSLSTLNKQLEQKTFDLEASYYNIKVLSEIGKKITSTINFEKILGTLYENINALMDATEFGIGIYDERKQEIDLRLYMYKSQNLSDIDAIVSMKEKNRLSVWCIENRKEVFINNIQKEYSKYISTLDAYKEEDKILLQSLICLPLMLEERIIGLISIQSPRKNAYTTYQLEMLRTLASYTAIALDNAQAYENLNKLRKTIKE